MSKKYALNMYVFRESLHILHENRHKRHAMKNVQENSQWGKTRRNYLNWKKLEAERKWKG